MATIPHLGSTATPTFLVPVHDAEEYKSFEATAEKSKDVTLRGGISYHGRTWVIVTVDQTFTFFEHFADKLGLDMHKCYKLEDLAADGKATEKGDHYEVADAKAFDLATLPAAPVA